MVDVQNPMTNKTSIAGIEMAKNARPRRSKAGFAQAWSYEDGLLKGEMKLTDKPFAVTYDPTGNHLLCVGISDFKIYVYTRDQHSNDTQHCQYIQSTTSVYDSHHTKRVDDICFSPDGKKLYTCAADAKVIVRDISYSSSGTFELGDHKTITTKHTDWVHGISFLPDGSEYITVSGDKTARVWDASTDELKEKVETEHADGVMSISHDHTGTFFITVSCDKMAHVFSAKDKTLLRKINTGHSDKIYGVQFHPNGRTFTTVSADRTARMFTIEKENETAIACISLKHTDRVRGITHRPDGKELVTIGEDSKACFYHVEVRFSPHGMACFIVVICALIAVLRMSTCLKVSRRSTPLTKRSAGWLTTMMAQCL